MIKTHWTTIRLYYADGSGITSEWDVARACATECNESERVTTEATTEEHLRALAEIRDSDTCANWFTNAELSEDGPRRDGIDWTGFVSAKET